MQPQELALISGRPCNVIRPAASLACCHAGCWDRDLENCRPVLQCILQSRHRRYCE
jgi:hypothetical protein